MKKKVLILDEGNAARSIMAEALINHMLQKGCGIDAQSAGLHPKGSIDSEVFEVLAEEGIEMGHLKSKGLEELPSLAFDLVVTVCDTTKASCPTLPEAKKQIHIGFDDPEGKPIEAYKRELHQMKRLLVPRVYEELCEE